MKRGALPVHKEGKRLPMGGARIRVFSLWFCRSGVNDSDGIYHGRSRRDFRRLAFAAVGEIRRDHDRYRSVVSQPLEWPKEGEDKISEAGTRLSLRFHIVNDGSVGKRFLDSDGNDIAVENLALAGIIYATVNAVFQYHPFCFAKFC
jgi:hypothetical protein